MNAAIYLPEPKSSSLPCADHVKEKWRSVATFVCLWLAIMTCSVAFSLLAPFFPTEVSQPVKCVGSMLEVGIPEKSICICV